VTISGVAGGQFLHALASSPASGATFFAFDDWRKGTTDRDVTGAVLHHGTP
jgi:hypothetical protein